MAAAENRSLVQPRRDPPTSSHKSAASQKRLATVLPPLFTHGLASEARSMGRAESVTDYTISLPAATWYCCSRSSNSSGSELEITSDR